jgi:hypothetical protein
MEGASLSFDKDPNLMIIGIKTSRITYSKCQRKSSKYSYQTIIFPYQIQQQIVE